MSCREIPCFVSFFVHKDIRNQRRYRLRRKQELRKLETTLERLKTKATFYEEQIDYYNKYIETCLDNLAGKETMYVYFYEQRLPSFIKTF